MQLKQSARAADSNMVLELLARAHMPRSGVRSDHIRYNRRSCCSDDGGCKRAVAMSRSRGGREVKGIGDGEDVNGDAPPPNFTKKGAKHNPVNGEEEKQPIRFSQLPP
ncbi:hypothetical protein Pfo_013902 [Paulownia fortunei]|nr:hypothetical protein Pfo_013902 [Paulownia fortunei]